MKKCPKCGAAIADESSFCGLCGSRIPEMSGTAIPTGRLIKTTRMVSYIHLTTSIGGWINIYDNRLEFKKMLPLVIGGPKIMLAKDMTDVEMIKYMGLSNAVKITLKDGKTYKFNYGVGVEDEVRGDVSIMKSIIKTI